MTGLDTNVVVRFLTADDPELSLRAKALFDSEELWLSHTVLLETEWVLRSAYQFPPEAIASSFDKLLGHPNLHSEDQLVALDALSWYAAGLDFADALHLSTTHHVPRFVTFDRQFAHRSQRIEDAPSVDLL